MGATRVPTGVMLIVAFLLASAAVALGVEPAESRVIGPADSSNTSTWDGQLLLWDFGTDWNSGVYVWDGAKGGSARLLEDSSTVDGDASTDYGVGDSFWSGGRAYWARSTSATILTARPDGSQRRTLYVGPTNAFIYRLVHGARRLAWTESTGLSEGPFRIMTAPMAGGRASVVARVEGSDPRIVMTDHFLAWAEVDDLGFLRDGRIHVRLIDQRGQIGSDEIVLAAASRGDTEALSNRSIVGEASRLAWDADDGIRTWRVGENAPLTMEAVDETNGWVYGICVTDSVVAWKEECGRDDARVLAWNASTHGTVSLGSGATKALSTPFVVDGVKVGWTEAYAVPPEGADSSALSYARLAVWNPKTGLITRTSIPLDAARDRVNSRVGGEWLTYVAPMNEGNDQLRVIRLDWHGSYRSVAQSATPLAQSDLHGADTLTQNLASAMNGRKGFVLFVLAALVAGASSWAVVRRRDGSSNRDRHSA